MNNVDGRHREPAPKEDQVNRATPQIGMAPARLRFGLSRRTGAAASHLGRAHAYG